MSSSRDITSYCSRPQGALDREERVDLYDSIVIGTEEHRLSVRQALQEVILKKAAKKNVCKEMEDLTETALSAMEGCIRQILAQPGIIESRRQTLTRKDLNSFLMKTMSWLQVAADQAEVKITSFQVQMASEWLIQVALSTVGSSLQASNSDSKERPVMDDCGSSFLERLIIKKAHIDKKVLTSSQVEHLLHKLCTDAKNNIQSAFKSSKKNRSVQGSFKDEKYIEKAIDGYQRLLQNHKKASNQAPEVVRQEAKKLALASWDKLAILMKEAKT